MSNADDPLSWAGDDELEAPPLPGSVRRPEPAPERVPVAPEPHPADATVVEPDGTRHDASDPLAGDGPDGEAVVAPEGMGSVALVIHGVLGGIFLLYTIGWFHLSRTTGSGLAATYTDVVGRFMFDLGLVLAVAAPVLWFLTTLYLGRGRPVIRVLVLVLGALVLVPWGVLS